MSTQPSGHIPVNAEQAGGPIQSENQSKNQSKIQSEKLIPNHSQNARLKKKRETTVSDMKAIIVADQIDQDVCEFFSPLASTGSLINEEDDSVMAARILSKLKANATTSAPHSYISRFEIQESIPETNVSAVAAVTTYDQIYTFLTKHGALFAWAAAGLITVAASCDFLRGFALTKCNEASVNLGKEQYIEALASATTATRANPFLAKAYFLRGQSLTKMLRYKEALECFNSGLTLDKDNLQALDERAAVALKLKKSEITISDISRIIELAPDQVTAFQIGNRAIAYFNSGEYRKALNDYDRALKMEPSSYSLQLSRAFCLTQDMQYAEALKACAALLQMDPDNNEVLTQQGYCKQQLGDKTGALNDFSLAIKKDPGSARWLTYRAGLYMTMGASEKALQDYCRAADRDLGNETAQYTAAKLCRTLKRNSDAVKYYERVSHFANFRTSFEKQLERAQVNLDQGNYNVALKDLLRVERIKSTGQILFMQAICYSHLKQNKTARDTMAEAVKLAGDSTAALLNRAEIEAVLGDNISAIDHYSQVLRIEPGNAEALMKRGQFYQKRSQWASAGQDFKRAIALGNKSTAAKTGLATCIQKLGDGARVSLNLPVAFNVDMVKLDVATLNRDGLKQFQQGNHAIAALYFTELARRDPDNLTTRRYLAHSLAGGGSHHEAVVAFHALGSVKLDSRDKLVYARSLAAIRQYENAIELVASLDKAAANGDTQYRFELAKLLSASGQNDKAIAICGDSLQQSSSHSRELANLYQSLKNDSNKNDSSKKLDTNDKTQSKPETEG